MSRSPALKARSLAVAAMVKQALGSDKTAERPPQAKPDVTLEAPWDVDADPAEGGHR